MSNPLEMSDEEFLKQPLPSTGEVDPVAEEPEDKTGEELQQEKEEEETPNNTDQPKADPSEDENPSTEEIDNKSTESEEASEQELNPLGSEPKADKINSDAGSNKANEPKDSKDKADDKSVTETVDYQQFYNKVMKPFTANGKEINLKNPDEAIQLMQMGANYTRKMQELAPHRKIITMLSNNDLLNESKLSFLIDLDKKDPEAIKRLIKDSGIDPLDIDTTTEPAYREGSHVVSDQEQSFRNHFEELSSNQDGLETLSQIDSQWDQSSKDMLWQHPEVMSIIHNQRNLGIYDLITGEVDRLKTLGQLPADIPFLEAYRIVGDRMHEANAFSHLNTETGSGNTATNGNNDNVASAPITTRAAAPKSDDVGNKANAAAPSRATPAPAKEAVNFLSMSDEEFMKAESLRGRV